MDCKILDDMITNPELIKHTKIQKKPAKLSSECMSTLFGGPERPSPDKGQQNLEQILADFKTVAEAAAVVSEDGNVLLPFTEAVMQSLLSTEILLLSIKELFTKNYSKYLTENTEKLTIEEK
uniref:Peroxin-19 n=1 Tax=Glossina palpalis gambiensis TaxID=67801 RepID=A0A1B0BKJ1_9MUSC